MENMLKDITPEDNGGEKNETKEWRKSITIGDDTKTIIVRKVKNGYIVSKCHDYKSNDGWKYDKEEYISKDNPLENDGDASTKPSIKDMVGNLDNNFLAL